MQNVTSWAVDVSVKSPWDYSLGSEDSPFSFYIEIAKKIGTMGVGWLLSLLKDTFSTAQVCSTKWVGNCIEAGKQSKEAAVAYYKAPSLQMDGGKPWKNFIRIASFRTDNLTRKLPSVIRRANLGVAHNGPGRGQSDGARPRQSLRSFRD
jgi:hypothetical protein